MLLEHTLYIIPYFLPLGSGHLSIFLCPISRGFDKLRLGILENIWNKEAAD